MRANRVKEACVRIALKGVRASRVKERAPCSDSDSECMHSSRVKERASHVSIEVQSQKESAYVSTKSSGQLNTFVLNHFSVYWKVS